MECIFRYEGHGVMSGSVREVTFSPHEALNIKTEICVSTRTQHSKKNVPEKSPDYSASFN